MTDFYIPVKLYEGKNSIWNQRQEFVSCGKKALILTGRSSAKKNGAYEEIKKALEEEQIESVLFDRIEENPSVGTIMKARDVGVAEGVDFVIGIGGGSPMDAAKAVALMVYHREEDQTYLYEKGADSSALPVIEVATTCGTGSEVTPYAILTDETTNTKGSIPHQIWAKAAYLDARYLQTMSKKVLCDTAMDAFGHMVESYINTNANDYSRMCVEKALCIWAECKPVLLGMADPDQEVYQKLLRASAMAGMAISVTGTSLPHGLSYGLTCQLDMAHGKAVGYFIPAYLREADRKDRARILQLAGFSGIEEVEDFYCKTCGRDAVSSEMLRLVGNAMLKNETKLKNCPFEIDLEKMERIVGVGSSCMENTHDVYWNYGMSV